MKKIEEYLKKPIYILLAILIAVISYMYPTNYSYNLGREIGKELVVSYKNKMLIFHTDLLGFKNLGGLVF